MRHSPAQAKQSACSSRSLGSPASGSSLRTSRTILRISAGLGRTTRSSRRRSTLSRRRSFSHQSRRQRSASKSGTSSKAGDAVSLLRARAAERISGSYFVPRSLPESRFSPLAIARFLKASTLRRRSEPERGTGESPAGPPVPADWVLGQRCEGACDRARSRRRRTSLRVTLWNELSVTVPVALLSRVKVPLNGPVPGVRPGIENVVTCP